MKKCKCGNPLPEVKGIEYEECQACYWNRPEHEWLKKGVK